jgi:hypothetical protein
MRNGKWVRLLAYVTGSVNQELLLQNEYLAAENRVLRTKLPGRLRLTDVDRAEKRGHFGGEKGTCGFRAKWGTDSD